MPDILLKLGELTPPELARLIELGGPVVIVLLAFSVLALAVILLKLWQFAVAGIGARSFAERALHHWFAGQTMEALRVVVSRRRSPLAKVRKPMLTLFQM